MSSTCRIAWTTAVKSIANTDKLSDGVFIPGGSHRWWARGEHVTTYLMEEIAMNRRTPH